MDAEPLKELVLNAAASLETFDIQYTLKKDYEHPEEGRVIKLSRVHYKRSGEDFYFRIEYLDETGAHREAHTYSFARGTGEYLQNYPNGEATGFVDMARVVFPFFPAGAYMLPEEIFGQEGGTEVWEWMMEGSQSAVFDRDGQLVLHCENPEKWISAEFYFDGMLHVTQIDWLLRPYELSEEAMAALWQGSPYDLRLKQSSVVLHDLTSINGVAFPMKAERLYWETDKRDTEALTAKLRSGELPQDEFLVQFYSMPQAVVGVQTMEVESIRINEPLTIADFRIDWPANAKKVDYASVETAGGAVNGPTKFCFRSINDISPASLSVVFAVLAATLALCAGGVFLVRRLRSHSKP
ncbi:MAG: hypothetical protein ACLFTT_04240 [Candidatus Hydrogenedentota bacterium]